MKNDGYGLWFLVVVNTAVVLLFAASFFRPTHKRDWRTFGAFSLPRPCSLRMSD